MIRFFLGIIVGALAVLGACWIVGRELPPNNSDDIPTRCSKCGAV